MAQIGVATVRFSYRTLSDSQLRSLGAAVFSAADREAQERLPLSVQIVVEIEDGSVKARTRIIAGAIVVGQFLSNYGSIRQGGEYLAKDVMRASRAVLRAVAKEAGVSPKDIIRTYRSATLSRRIRGIVSRVEQGQLNSDVATAALLKLIDPNEEGAFPDSFVRDMRRELRSIRARPRAPRLRYDQELIPLVVSERYSDDGHGLHWLTSPPAETPRKPRRLRFYLQRAGNGTHLHVEED